MNKIKNNIFKNKYKKDKGIALVIAIASITLLLSLSLSISNIVLRQIRITNINNSSKGVFFTADSAAECARYFDTKLIQDPNSEYVINKEYEGSIFGINGFNDYNPSDPADLTTQSDFMKLIIKCGDSPISGISKNTTEVNTVTFFDVDYGQTCARVQVIKNEAQTTIVSRGYNTTMAEAGCDLSDIESRRIVERGLTITY